MNDFGNWLLAIFACWIVGAAIIGLLCEAKDLPELTEEEKQSELDWWNANR